jgi:hypothetical protein
MPFILGKFYNLTVYLVAIALKFGLLFCSKEFQFAFGVIYLIRQEYYATMALFLLSTCNINLDTMPLSYGKRYIEMNFVHVHLCTEIK